MKAAPHLRSGSATEAAAEELFAREPRIAMYVPRRATEAALRRLVSEIEADTPLMLLSGPAGLGKSLIVRKLAEIAQARMRCVELSARRTRFDAIQQAVRTALGEEAGRANRGPSRSLSLPGLVLLLLDDAEGLPTGGMAGLLELALESKGRLQILAVGRAAPEGRPSPRALEPGMAWIQLSDAMSLRETLRYVRSRLELAVAPPELRRWFGPVAVTRLWRESEGNPARLHELARHRLGLEGLAPSSGSEVVQDVVEPPAAQQPQDPVAEAPLPTAPEPVSKPPRLRILDPASEKAGEPSGRELAAALRRSIGSEAALAASGRAAEAHAVASDAGSGAPAVQARPVSPAPDRLQKRPRRRLSVDGAIAPAHEPRDPPDWLDDAIAIRLLDAETVLALTPPKIPAPPGLAAAQSSYSQDARDRVTAISAALMFISLSAFLFVLFVVAVDTLITLEYGNVRYLIVRYFRFLLGGD